MLQIKENTKKNITVPVKIDMVENVMWAFVAILEME